MEGTDALKGAEIGLVARLTQGDSIAKISMLRLNIGSGKLSSCMLSIGLGPKCEQGKGGGCPPLP